MALQRQGRIGFYGEARGQEAAVIGAAAALGPDDWVVPALREAGAALYRGLPLRTYVAQIFGNANDVAKGRQLPCHPGTPRARTTCRCRRASRRSCRTRSAWRGRRKHQGRRRRGARLPRRRRAPARRTSTSRLNFAGVYQACRWCSSARTTSGRSRRRRRRRRRRATFAVKALAYGMPRRARRRQRRARGLRRVRKDAVDARARGGGPTLVEALTYRVGGARIVRRSDALPRRRRPRSGARAIRSRASAPGCVARASLDEAADAALRAEIDAEVREAIAAEEERRPAAAGEPDRGRVRRADRRPARAAGRARACEIRAKR